MGPPFQQTEAGKYCRLLPRSEAELDHHGLVLLGKAMVDEGGDVSNPPPPDEYLPDAGYTYFGQFLDHDLTEMDPLGRVIAHVTKDFNNLQSPQLDLSHLYGDGANPAPGLYEADGMTFKIGPVGARGGSFDVYVDPATDVPVVADSRSHENIMLRQIVAVFLRLHNLAVRQFGHFEAARQAVRWQFQYLVVEDYLQRMLDPSVYKKVFIDKNYRFDWEQFSIPAEFAGAAMRFGHSMVRPSYVFPNENDQSLKDILHRANKGGQLEDPWEIPWSLFFQGAPGGTLTMTSRPIDTLIAKPLHELMPHTVARFTVDKAPLPPPVEPFRLPVRTLLRGAQLKFPSGQIAADEFGERRLTSAELLRPRGKNSEHGAILEKFGFLTETPLWYYILKESEVRWNGSYVGPVGSHIIAETIAGALRYDPTSYWNVQPPGGSWPPRWQVDGGTTQLFMLMDLFRFATTL